MRNRESLIRSFVGNKFFGVDFVKKDGTNAI